MGEHVVVVALERRRLEQPVEHAADLIGHRHRARGSPRLRCPVAPADVVAPHADHAGDPVDITPAQREQLAEPQSGHRRHEVQRPVDLLVHAAPGVLDQPLELGERQEPDLLGLGDRGQLGAVARVRARPLPSRRLGEVEQRRQRADDVADRLRRQPLALERRDQVGDVVGVDPRRTGDRRRTAPDGCAISDCDVLDGRGLARLAAACRCEQIASRDFGDRQLLAGRARAAAGRSAAQLGLELLRWSALRGQLADARPACVCACARARATRASHDCEPSAFGASSSEPEP